MSTLLERLFPGRRIVVTDHLGPDERNTERVLKAVEIKLKHDRYVADYIQEMRYGTKKGFACDIEIVWDCNGPVPMSDGS